MHLSKITKSNKSWKEEKNTGKRTSKSTHVLDFREKPKKKKRSKGSFKSWVWSIVKNKKFAYTAGALFGLIVIVSFVIIAWLSRGLPDPNRLIERDVAQSTKIYDRTGKELLYEVSGDVRRTMVSLNDIPEYLKQATITIEDKDFYKHGGISYWAIFRTAITNTLFNKKAGGSTLTQQFVKNAVLTTEKRYVRKLKEAVMAVKLENRFTKDEILQMYLNEIPYGSTAYGVEAASQYYFGKHVQEITLAEAAVLAALPQSPSRYSPYGSHKDILISRQQYILDQMVKYGYIDKDQAEAAKKEKLVFKKPASNITAPHFVMYIKEILEERYGTKMIEQGGLNVISTLDLDKQKIAEETVKTYGEKNVKYDANNAALVSVDPKTGQVLAMVGSRDYFNESIDGQVNITTSLRQPGSSLKPLVYAAAFIRGYTPNTILYDVLTNFSNDSGKTYEPHNYNGKENGPVSMRKALAGSLNIPAVKTLYLAGVNRVLDLADDIGYTTLKDRDRFGLSIVLGGGEVKMIEHVNAYSAFANDGKVFPASSILKITDKDGKTLEEWKANNEKKVFDANIARLVTDILSDDGARAYMFGARSGLTLSKRPAAAKTGTTNDYRDAWTIGYTPSLVTGVWVGNNDNASMKKGSAAAVIAVPIWHDYMEKALKDAPVEQFTKPAIDTTGKDVLDGKNIGEQKVKIDRSSGLLATSSTPPNLIEEKAYVDPHCILYYINKNDPRGDHPKDPQDDPQFNLWESRVRAWAEKQNLSTSTPPKDFDNVHKEENKPQFKIITPSENDNLTVQFLNVRIEATAPRGIGRAEYYIDGNLIDIVKNYPFNLERSIDFLANGFHAVKVIVCDDVDNCSEQTVNFRLSVNGSMVNDSFGTSITSKDMTVHNKDYPLPLLFNFSNLRNILKAEALYSDKEGNIKAIGNIPLSGESVQISWPAIPASGVYQVWSKAYGWNSKTAESQKITVIVKNSEK